MTQRAYCPHCGRETTVTSWGSSVCANCRRQLVETGERKWDAPYSRCRVCGGKLAHGTSNICHPCWRKEQGRR